MALVMAKGVLLLCMAEVDYRVLVVAKSSLQYKWLDAQQFFVLDANLLSP